MGAMPSFPRIPAARRRIGARDFDFDHRVAVMAIINRTRDSFYDAGRTYELSRAVEAALAAAEAGADIVDIGGVPFSPDAYGATESEEIDLVVPFVEAVAGHSDVVISVDTVRSGVAAAAIAAGAAIVNDTSGLWDPAMAPLIAGTGATIILTHSRAEPHKHLRKPHYDDVVAEVRSFLVDRVERLLAAGASEDQLIVDPGPDLNKNTLHTLEILSAVRGDHLDRAADARRALEQGLRRGDPGPSEGTAARGNAGGHHLVHRTGGEDRPDARRATHGGDRENDGGPAGAPGAGIPAAQPRLRHHASGPAGRGDRI